MRRHLLQIIPLFAGMLCLVQCAQVAPLTGGPRDTAAPQLKEATPPDQSTGFLAGTVVLTFDEFVQLGDMGSQLIVSPKMKEAPQVVADGKKVRITLNKEELLPNTTYRLYFGQAIADVNEGNALPNFAYTFSTGNYIDSLRLRGQVTEAFNNLPAGEVVVALYREGLGDSLPYHQTPDYLSRTDAAGSFSFSNLPHTRFSVYAFSDKNKNNLYDGEVEKIAFRDSLLQLRSDSSLTLHLFRENPPKYFIKKTMTPYYGLVTVLLSKKTTGRVSALAPSRAADIYELQPGTSKDTLLVYYRNITDTLRLLLNNAEAQQTDTLVVPLPKRSKTPGKITAVPLNTINNQLPYGRRPRLLFGMWMDTSKTDLQKLRLREASDTGRVGVPVRGSWVNATVFEINAALGEDKKYVLTADTGAFTNVHGHISDSLKLTFKTQSRTELGTLRLQLMFDRKQNYIVQLIDEKETPVAEHTVLLPLSASTAKSIDFTDLQPGTYRVKVIEDSNGNGKWDTGHLVQKLQPERTIVHEKQIKVLADWEIEEQIHIKL